MNGVRKAIEALADSEDDTEDDAAWDFDSVVVRLGDFDSEELLLFVLLVLFVMLTVREGDDEKDTAGDTDLEMDLE